MMNRHGLIAGRDRHRQDEDAAGHRRAALGRRRAGLRRRRQGRRLRPARPGAGRRARRASATPSSAIAVTADRLPGRVPVDRRHRPRRAGARDRLATSGRSCSARCSAPTRRRSRASALVFHYADTKAPAAARPHRPARAARPSSTPTRARPSSRASAGSRARPSACCCATSSTLETGGGNEFFGEPQFDIADLLRTAPDGRGIISCLELPAVQDKPKLFSTVLMWLLAELFEDAARGRRPRQAQARLLLRRGAPAVQRREQGVRRVRHADRAPDPLQGRRRLLRHADAEGRARPTCSASSATASSTRCARSRRTTQKALKRDRQDVPEVASSTTSRSC